MHVLPLQTRSTAARVHVIQGVTADSRRTTVEKAPERYIPPPLKKRPTEHQARHRIILLPGQAREVRTLLLPRLHHQDHAAIQRLRNPTVHHPQVPAAVAQDHRVAVATAEAAAPAAAQAVQAAEAAPAAVVHTAREAAHAEAGKNP